MKISKLLSTNGYDEGLWDLSFSLRKRTVSTEEIPGGLMKGGKARSFLTVLQSLSRLIHFMYSKMNSPHSWNV